MLHRTNVLLKPLLLLLGFSSMAGSIINRGENVNIINWGDNANTGNIVIDGQVVSGNTNTIKGSGNKKSIDKKIAAFEQIISNSALDIVYQQSGKSRIEITGDDNIITLVQAEVNNGVLTLDVKKSYSSTMPLVVRLQSASLNALTVAGSSDVKLTAIQSKKLRIKLSGSGEIIAKGKVQELSIKVQGAGDVNTKRLTADSVQVSLSGSGDIILTALQSLKADLSGSGDIVYYGNPGKIDKRITGAGDFEAGDE